MARNYPKRKSWAKIYDQLSKFETDLNRPPVPMKGGDEWKRNRCWQETLDWAKSNNATDCIAALSEDDYYATNPFYSCELTKEDFTGKIGDLLKELSLEDRWNKKKYELVRRLISNLEEEGYIGFPGHGSTYPISTVGSSFICKVPSNKQGKLKIFRGKIIRVVCTGSGIHSYRHYMAGLLA